MPLLDPVPNCFRSPHSYWSRHLLFPIAAAILPQNTGKRQKADVLVQAYPNPFVQDQILHVTNVPAAGPDNQVSLYTADGKVIYRRKLVVAGNATVHSNDRPDLTRGIYRLCPSTAKIIQ